MADGLLDIPSRFQMAWLVSAGDSIMSRARLGPSSVGPSFQKLLGFGFDSRPVRSLFALLVNS